jgi:recombinational DNA repair protein (RecF pathway)
MKLEKAKGIILKKKEINEKDVIIDVLLYNSDNTYQRKKFLIYGILKSKKRNPIIVEIANFVQIDYYDKKNIDILSIKEINLINRFYYLKNTYEKLLFLSQILELTYFASLSDNYSLKEIYILLYSALQYLDSYYHKEQTYNKNLNSFINDYFYLKEVLLLFFSFRLLKIMGYVGDLNHCSNCNKVMENKVKWQEGLYFYCENCDPTSNEIDFNCLKIFQIMQKNKFDIFLTQLKILMEKLQKEKKDIHLILTTLEDKLNLYLKEIFPLGEKNLIKP